MLRKSLKLPDSELSALVPVCAAADAPDVMAPAAAAALAAATVLLCCAAATEAILMACCLSCQAVMSSPARTQPGGVARAESVFMSSVSANAPRAGRPPWWDAPFDASPVPGEPVLAPPEV